jgi:hypothetical protein
MVLAIFAYAGSKWFDGHAASTNSGPPAVAASHPVEGKVAVSADEIEALKRAVSEQNGTNQQTAAALAAFRAELQQLRRELDGIHAAGGKSASTTGSINPGPVNNKQARASTIRQGQRTPLPLAAPNSR